MSAFKVTSRILQDVHATALDDLKRSLIARVVNVGFPEGPTETDGTPIALIAATHEFGSPTRGIPERSFLRSALNENLAKYVRLNKVNLVRVLRGQLTAEQALGQLGEMAKGHVQHRIRDGKFAPLKSATIAHKGSSKPLIDSGNMMQAVTYVVEAGR